MHDHQFALRPFQSESTKFEEFRADDGQSRSLLIKRAIQHIEPLSKRYVLRNEGSIHRPRGLSVLYCPSSDGTPNNSSIVPAGLFNGACQPRTASWAKFSRPYGT
jgi:hypothetical protein